MSLKDEMLENQNIIYEKYKDFLNNLLENYASDPFSNALIMTMQWISEELGYAFHNEAEEYMLLQKILLNWKQEND